MRRLILLILMLGSLFGQDQVIVARRRAAAPSGPGYGGVAYSGAIVGNNSGDVLTTTAAIPAGSTIVLFYGNSTATNVITGVTDSGCGGTWAVEQTHTDYSQSLAHVVCTNGLASGGTITASHGTGFNSKAYVVMWATSATGGINNSSACAGMAGPTPFPVTCPVVVSVGNTILFYSEMQGSYTYTVDAAWTPVGSVTDSEGDKLWYGYRLGPTATTYDPGGHMPSQVTFNILVGAYQ